ncbi:MAG: nucleotidyltransferase family protein [Clostridia bacterium]|nr:nucleotidyltransferase family protein [Clostridia bacterium]
MTEKQYETIHFSTLIIRAISAAFCDKKIDDFSVENWQDFFTFCASHNVMNLVAYALKKSSVVLPKKVSHFFEESLLHSMLKEAQRSVEIESLCDDFEKNEIPHMVLKGFVIKKLYPEEYLRSMGDVDILVGGDVSKAIEITKNHDFSYDSEEFLHHSFSKGKGLNVELHKSLIDESLDEYYSYFGTGFERAHLADGYQFRYELSKEDFYVFLVAHMAKHYQMCGTGIRFVCDIYVFNSKYKDKLDYKYISKELQKIGLKKFEEKIRQLSFQWFGGNFDGKFDAIGEYIVSNGVHGKSVNHELNKFLLNDEKKQSKFSYILTTIFPGKDYMQARYSKLKKYPFLLPLYWIRRIFSTLIKSSGSIRYRLKGVALSDKDDYKKFDDAGLR